MIFFRRLSMVSHQGWNLGSIRGSQETRSSPPSPPLQVRGEGDTVEPWCTLARVMLIHREDRATI